MIKNIDNMPQIPDIRTLVNRYLSGETTNEEEATLRAWFRLAGDMAPKEWLPIKAMLSFVDEERQLLVSKAEHETLAKKPSEIRTTLLQAFYKPRIWISTAVAAAAIAITLVVPTVYKSFGNEPLNYAVIDGKVYTSPKVIKQQANNALQAVSADGENPFSALDMMQ